MPRWWASAGSPPCLRSRLAKRSGAAFSPATNGGGPVEHWPGSILSLTVTQMSSLWTLNGKMFRLGSEQRVCSQGDVVVSPASCCRGEPPAA